MGRAFKEKRHWNLKDLRNLLQPARADAVRALLVFLHLLEREIERVPELLLTHAKHHPPHPNAASDMLVGRVGTLFYHSLSFEPASMVLALFSRDTTGGLIAFFAYLQRIATICRAQRN